jgi:hypothetical protein
MSWVGFEPTIPAFERVKTFYASDRAATVIGQKGTRKWYLWKESKLLNEEFIPIILSYNA